MPASSLFQRPREKGTDWIKKSSSVLRPRSSSRPRKTRPGSELQGFYQTTLVIERDQAKSFSPAVCLFQEGIEPARRDIGGKSPVILSSAKSILSQMFTFTTWEQAIIVITVVGLIITFIIAVLQAIPELTKIFGSLIPVVYAGPAAGALKSPPKPLSVDYGKIKELVITGFAMAMCFWSAAVYYHGTKPDRKNMAADLIKYCFGFLLGKHT